MGQKTRQKTNNPVQPTKGIMGLKYRGLDPLSHFLTVLR